MLKTLKKRRSLRRSEALGYICTCMVYACVCVCVLDLILNCVQLDIVYTYIVALVFLWMLLEKQQSYLCVPEMGWTVIHWYIHTNNYIHTICKVY